MDHHLTPLQTWMATIGTIALLLVFALVLNYWLHRWEAHRRAANDLDVVSHRDEALRRIESWYTEPHLYEESVEDQEMRAMLNRALETPGKTVVFTRGEDGVLREGDGDAPRS